MIWPAAAGTLGALTLLAGFAPPRPLVFRFGPADKDYVQGFRVGWARGTTARWARARARLELPVSIRGPARLILIGGRPERPPAEIELRQGSHFLGRFMVGEKTAPYAFALSPEHPGVFHLEAPASDVGHGMKLERVILEPGRSWAILPNSRLIFRAGLGAALLAAALGASGLGGVGSTLGALALLSLPLGVMAFFDPYAALHLASKVSLLAPAVTAVTVLLLPRRMARQAVWVFALALTFRCGLLFHPSYYFMDVDIHRRVAEVASNEGPRELWSRIDYYQQRFDLGRASVAGRFRPLPYPPTFHTLAGLVSAIAGSTSTEDVIKALGATSQAAAILLLMLLARRLSPQSPVPLLVGLLAAFFPEDILELLRASYPALLGHLVDLAMVTFLFLRWESLRTIRGAAAFAIGLAACMLTYNASPVHFSLFLPLLFLAACVSPAIYGRAGLFAAGVGGAVLSLPFYGRYIGDMLSNVFSGQATGEAPTLSYRILVALGGWDAFGPFYLLLGAVGLGLVLRRWWREPTGRLIAAWAGYALAISIPVFLVPEPFYYFRRLYFTYPLALLLAAYVPGKKSALAAVAALTLLTWSFYRLSFFVAPFFITHTGSLAPG